MPATANTPRSSEKTGCRPVFNPSFLFTFFIMFCIWIVLSGRFDVFHISLGGVSSLIVAAVSKDFLLPDLSARSAKQLPRLWLRFVAYIPWLLYQILLANLHVLAIALHPKMMDRLDPRLIVFKTRLKGDMAQVALANAITLTPGTITVSVSAMGAVTVHTLDSASAENLPGEMEEKLLEVFRE